MRPGRRINSNARALVAFHLGQCAVHILAHAMQALEFEGLFACKRLDCADGVGVMRCKRRIHCIVGREHFFCTCKVADIGTQFAGKHRKILETANMAKLDLGVPIGPFHKPDEELAVMLSSKASNPVDHRHAAFLIGLDSEAETFPTAAVRPGEETVITCQGFDEIHRKFEPVSFFCVDREMDVRIACGRGEIAYDRQQIGNREICVEEGVLRVQCRKLDRDTRRSADISCRFADQPVDRLVVIDAIAFGIVVGHRRFAKHVEAVRQALCTFWLGTLERFVDRTTIDKLPTQNAHGLQSGRADHGFAKPIDRTLERLAHSLLRFFGALENLSRQHQRECRCVNEGGRTFAHVLRPIDVTYLVPDQCIGRRRIRHTQQSFGEAHQRYAFFRRQTILLQECIDPTGFALARVLDQPDGYLRCFRVFGACAGCLCHAFRDTGIFFRSVSFANGLAGDGGQADRIVQGHTTPKGKED